MRKSINLSVATLIALTSVNAGAVIIDAGTRRAPTSSGPVINSGITAPAVVTTINTSAQTCSDGTMFPLKLLQMITESGEGIQISGFDSSQSPKSIVVKIPEYIRACTNFQVNVMQDPKSTNVAVTIENKFDFKAYYEEKGWTVPSNFSSMSGNDKYEDCLKKEGIIVSSDSGYSIVRPEYKEQNYATTISQPAVLQHFDEKKPMSVFFGSPRFLGREYGAAFRFQETELVGDQCLRLEDVKEDGGALYTKRDAEEARLFDICQNGNYDAIKEALRSLGNAPELRRTLEIALNRAADERAAAIFERLGAIEDRFRAGPEDRKEGRTVGVSEKQARTLAREYGDLLKELNDVVYTPSIHKIEELLKEKELVATTEQRSEQIDDEIRALNERIGQFSKRSESQLGAIYNGLKEYSLGDEAKKIEGFRLKSSTFARVYDGKRDKRGPPLTITDANEAIVKQLKRFENEVIRDWDDAYLAKQGSDAPIRAAQREVQTTYGRLQSEYQKYVTNEQSEYKRYCSTNWIGGVQNPARCQRWQQGQQARQKKYLQSRERRLKQIQAQTNRSNALTGYYDEAQRRIAAETEYSNDPYGIYDTFGASDFYSDLGGLGGQQNFGAMTNMMGGQQMQTQVMPYGTASQFNNPNGTMLTNPLQQMPQQNMMMNYGYY